MVDPLLVPWTVRYCHVDPKQITHKIVWNPSYSPTDAGIPDTSTTKVRWSAKPETRAAILRSIERDGVRNPILVYKTEAGMFLAFGGGRLEACHKLDRLCPALVVDYTHELRDEPEVTPENWASFFTDVPKHFEWRSRGPLYHYGMERLRDEDFDPGSVAWCEDDPHAKAAIVRESPWLEGKVK